MALWAKGDILAPFFLKYQVFSGTVGGGANPLSSFPLIQQVQLEAETHLVTMGFSTVWPSLTTRVPHVLAQTVV